MKLFQRLINLLKQFKSTRIKYHLSGKEINLTGDNTTIKSTNFSVDKYGNMKCNSATVNNANVVGGSMSLTGGTQSNPKFKVSEGDNSTSITPTDIFMKSSSGGVYINNSSNNSSKAYLYADSTGGGITLGGDVSNDITLRAGTSPDITCHGKMYANSYNYLSKESLKKNIEKFDRSVLDIIVNSELYQFNYNREKDTDKRHIGFVIADKGGSYKTPQEVLAQGKEGIDSYTMSSILWRGFQEQQELIEQLQNEIKELKGEK